MQSARPSPDLELRGIGKSFGGHVAIDTVDLRVERGEFIAIMGPSGCGKTTLLRVIAGLEMADTGLALMRGQSVDDLPVHKRKTRLVWQNYALFPHLSVRGNIAFGLTLRKHDKAEVRRKVEAVAELVQLESLLDRRIGQLSGGQKQRVAIARALVTEPDILLLDEPLSALDAHLRSRVQGELKRLQQRLGISFIYVTHNQSEAFSMADRVVVMNAGRVEQIGTPQEIYTHPATRFVAEFVGQNNIFNGTVAAVASDHVVIAWAGGLIRALLAHQAPAATRVYHEGEAISVVVQAGKLARVASGEPLENHLDATLTQREFTGSQVIYFLKIADGTEVRMLVQEPFSGADAAAETATRLYWSARDVIILPDLPRRKGAFDDYGMDRTAAADRVMVDA